MYLTGEQGWALEASRKGSAENTVMPGNDGLGRGWRTEQHLGTN